MRSISLFTLIALLLIVPPAMSGEARISLDGIETIVSFPSGDYAVAGSILKFHIRYTNQKDSGYNIDNMWEIYSPDGATWTDSAKGGNFHGANLGPIGIDTTGFLSKALFPSAYALRTFSGSPDNPAGYRADGRLADTVRFSGAGNDIGLGLTPFFDNRVLSILIKTNAADTGKTICIDSTMRCYPT